MSMETLIHEIKLRRPLWDISHEDRSNPDIINSLWDEIAFIVGEQRKFVKTKWKSLRDSFLRETKLYKKRCITHPELKKRPPKWPYYKQMMFLIGHFRKDINNYNHPSKVNTDSTNEKTVVAECSRLHLEAIDSGALIAEVKSRPHLWDKSDDFYEQHPISQNKCWSEIAETLGSTSIAVRRKWKGLRDTFRRELKKINSNTTTANSTWKFFSAMKFLKDNCYFEVPISNIVIPKVEVVRNNTSSFLKNGGQNSSLFLHQDIRSDPLSNPSSSAKTVLTDLLQSFQRDLIDLERTKMEHLNLSQQDDDMMFFQSLLPYVKSLAMDRKFILRTKIQQMVCDYALNNQNSFNVP